MTLDHYRPLGRSGLIVSPLALGTMTFGVARWGMDRPDAEAVFDAYVGAGGKTGPRKPFLRSRTWEEMRRKAGIIPSMSSTGTPRTRRPKIESSRSGIPQPAVVVSRGAIAALAIVSSAQPRGGSRTSLRGMLK